MRFQTTLALGITAIIAFLLYKFFTNNTVQGLTAAAGTGIENAATGQLSATQSQEIIATNAAGIVAAGNGSVTQAQANAQAAQDFAAANDPNNGAPTYWDGVKAAFSEIF